MAVALRTHIHTNAFNGPLSGTTHVSWYQKGKTNLDFTEARDSEWQWHQLGHMQVCTSLQTNNHASTPPLSFLQAGCPSCRPNNSVKALHEGSHWHRVNHIKSAPEKRPLKRCFFTCPQCSSVCRGYWQSQSVHETRGRGRVMPKTPSSC